MRPTTTPETILRSICRRLRKEGARMSVYAASDTSAIAAGFWPGVCEEIGLVLVGDEGQIQVQAGERVVDVGLDAPDSPTDVLRVLYELASSPTERPRCSG